MSSEVFGRRPAASAICSFRAVSLLMVVVLLAVVGCERSPDSNRRIDGAMLEDGPVWTIAETPDLMISAVQAGPDSIFFFRLTGAMFLETGEIVVGVGGEHRLIYLDDRGAPLAAAGRQGEGPGEFLNLTGVFSAGDGVAVWDLMTRRVTTFSRDGSMLGVLTLPVPAAHRVIGVTNADHTVTSPSTVIGRTAGERRRYELWDQMGHPLGELLGPPEPESPVVALLAVRDGRTSTVRTELDDGCLPDLMEVVVDGRVLVADASDGTLWALDQAGNAETIFETAERPSVSAGMLEAIRERIRQLEQAPAVAPTPGGGPALAAASRIVQQSLDSLMVRVGGVGDPVPAVWSEMFADRLGRLWLRRAVCYGDQSHAIWQIVEPSGKPMANVAVPIGMKLWHADENRILAQVTDSLGIDHLAIMSIEQ